MTPTRSIFGDVAIDAAERATPPCPHFGPCGGCQLQDLAYAAQLAWKADRLKSLLAPLDIFLPELEIHPSPPFAYRNRIRLSLGQVNGELHAGYIRGSTAPAKFPEEDNSASASAGSFLPITQCPIAAPLLWRAAEAFLALMRERGAAMRIGKYVPDQLELFTSADESRLQLMLFLRTAARSLPEEFHAAFTSFCEALRARVPELTGAGIALLPLVSTERSRRAETSRPGPAWGSPGFNYSVRGLHSPTAPGGDYWVPRGAFFQANRYLLPELLALATANRAGALAWDLYAGVGLFSRALARTFARVTAVEAAEPAATALAATGLKNLRAVKATTFDFLRTAVLERERPGLIVLDPPRSGAGPEVCALLARIAAPTLIYVSCSPQMLPTDLKTLTASGYTLAELHLVDLFPQTTHIETVAVLTR
jgi:23S rRNA (uracil1939-C5)-methyltransferase